MSNESRFQQADTYANSPYVELTRANSQVPALADGVNTRLQYDTVLVNDNGAWSSVNHEYTCFKAGRVQLNTATAFSSINTATVFAFYTEVVLANSAGVGYRRKRLAQYNDLKTSYVTIVGSISIPVNVGDKLWLEAGVYGSTAVIPGYNTFPGVFVELTHATIYYLP